MIRHFNQYSCQLNLVEREIINLYPNYEYKTQINNDDMIVHYRLRDRSDIIAARKST